MYKSLPNPWPTFCILYGKLSLLPRLLAATSRPLDGWGWGCEGKPGLFGTLGKILLEPKGIHTSKGSKAKPKIIENVPNGLALGLTSPSNSAYWGQEANSGSHHWIGGLEW